MMVMVEKSNTSSSKSDNAAPVLVASILVASIRGGTGDTVTKEEYDNDEIVVGVRGEFIIKSYTANKGKRRLRMKKQQRCCSFQYVCYKIRVCLIREREEKNE